MTFYSREEKKEEIEGEDGESEDDMFDEVFLNIVKKLNFIL